MAFASGGGGGGIGAGMGGIAGNLAQPSAAQCGIPSLRPQDAQALSSRGVANLNAVALAAAQVSATPIPAAHLLYQQFLSAGAAAAQSQLMQSAAAVSQAAALSPPTPLLPQAAAAAAAAANAVAAVAAQQQSSIPSQQQQAAAAAQPQQQQQQNQAFVLANAAQAIAINQLLLQHNPLQQQVQAALAQLLNPFAYYQPHLAALLQSQLNATNHVQQPQQPLQLQVPSAIGTPVAAQQQHQQKLIDNLLAEQAVRNSVHDKIGASQPLATDNRNVGLLTNPESVKEHISRLISENEAILEQSPGLIKRRPYHRQVGSQSSIELETGIRSQSNSPGLREIRLQCTRSQSFYESHKPLAIRVTGGSLTNGYPIVKIPDKCCTCNYCELKFPNEAALDAHEIRCSKRAEINSQVMSSSSSSVMGAAILGGGPLGHLHMMQQQNTVNVGTVENVGRKPSICSNNGITSSSANHENRHPLKRRLLAAVEHLDDPQASTSKAPKLVCTQLKILNHTFDKSMVFHIYNFVFYVTCLRLWCNETSKAILNTANSVAPSSYIGHCKTPIVSLRNHSIIISSASASASSAIVPITCHISSQLVIPKTPQAYQRIYLAATTPQNISSVANKPYILTLNEVSSSRSDATSRRSRMRNITTETFATLNKPQPMFCEHIPKLSMYSNWQQSTVDSEEAKLNLLYISTCSTKPRMGVKQLWRYTTALREMSVLKVTHSSFWDYSTKIRLRQNAAVVVTTGAPINSQAVIAAFVQDRPSTATSTSSVSMNVVSSSAIPLKNIQKSKVGNDMNVSKRRNLVEIEKDQNVLPTTEVVCKQSQGSGVENELSKTLSQKIVGGYFSDEVYVYVRGRGRGRYVCDRCGIRCKKPSMLKKHIKSHLDIRPYGCKQCNFNFKTKGNLTKHLQSKTHHRRIAEKDNQKIMDQDSDSDHDRLEIASLSGTASTFSNDPLSDDDCSSDEELRPPCDESNTDMYRKFGQENTLVKRMAHTPPTLWIVGETLSDWPHPNHLRSCHSAPPSAQYPAENRKQPNTLDTNFLLKKDSIDDQKLSMCNAVVAETIAPTTSDSISVSSCVAVHQRSVGAFLAKETIICDICKRAFRSWTEMSLHRKIHLIGPSNSRVRSHQCTECKQATRTRSALNKHMEEKHGIVEVLSSEQQSTVSDNEDTNANLSSMNPRSFMCADCNIGFRKHGILAKHLRSKTHIIKLESLRIIPEDSLSLITRKEGGAYLNEIDTTDCDRARQSILGIISSLRDSSALECREQMVQSPVPPQHTTVNNNCSVANKNITSNFSIQRLKKQRSPALSPQSFNENKRLLCEQQPRSKRHDVTSAKASTEMSSRKSNNNISQQRKAVTDDLNGKSISANIWIPPKLDTNSASLLSVMADRRSVDIVSRLAVDPANLSDNGSSARSDEANSEGAGRSESSTPTQRILAGTAPSPLLPVSTRCNLCEINYESSFELQVHLHADHVVLRDGKDFCCPKKHCDKVYPTRDSLRQHIAAHYLLSGAVTPLPDSRDEIEGAITVLSDASTDANAALHRKLTGLALGQHANSAPNHSPNAPEESHTTLPKTIPPASSTLIINGNTKQRPAVRINEVEKSNGCSSIMDVIVKDQRRSKTTQLPVTSTSLLGNAVAAPAALPCAICGQSFPDAFVLQRHWLSHVCDRPYICKQCDAGFTTSEALNTHTLTHQINRTER
ncbi:unnamed protein product [Thelazia callipaeda]|uniref:C2H2-type domain-containing protein n=1 Tax=Thelazia callipaeda TaxID=103827 RepID=A0A0N5CL55_THECL|nr:unnamed protein product [Thelazia callipaeda]